MFRVSTARLMARGGRGRRRSKPAKVSLVAIDCDGTLFNHDGDIHKLSVEAIAEVRARGINVICATGRARAAAMRPLQEYGHEAVAALDGLKGGVFLSGSWALCPQDGSTLRDVRLSQEAIARAAKICESLGRTLTSVNGDNFTCNSASQWTQWLEEKGGTPVIKPVGGDTIAISPAHQLIAGAEAGSQIDALTAALAEGGVDKSVGAQVLHPLPFIIDIIPVEDGPTNQLKAKAAGLRVVCEQLGIPTDEVLAIGDSNNDVDMLTWAGHSVAMGNAKSNVKDTADWIVSANDDEVPGVAEALRELILSA
eukprot:Hpha_TRINITY_DN16302_c1_g9::TRINITY_DN16302_c1_g9_i1::g.60461::m.60461